MSKVAAEIVQAKPLVKIVLTGDFTKSGGGIYVDFSKKLTFRGSDFKVYATTGYQEHTGDSPFLRNILNSLMNGEFAISMIDVKSFSLHIANNRTTDTGEIMHEIDYAVQRAGYTTELTDSSNKY